MKNIITYEQEKPNAILAIMLLITAFFIIYSPFQIGERELYWRECEYAAIAADIDLLMPVSTAHNEIKPLYPPAYPWVVSIVSKLGIKIESALRFVSLFSLICIAVIVWEACRRASGIGAACVGTAMMISSGIVMDKGIAGYPSLMGLLFLLSAWMSWYDFGIVRSKWNKAWICSFFFCGLSFFTLGWYGIIYFIFPLIFMRRPMTVWRKLKWTGLYIGLGLLAIFITYWLITMVGASSHYDVESFSLVDYFKHLITYPFEVCIRLLPWTIFAWTPYCVAFQPLEKQPIFCRFLRIITISLFFLLWLNPFTNSRDTLILVPCLAILTGMNYWLLVRRYGPKLHHIMQFISYLMAVLSIFIVLFYLTPTEVWKDLQSLFSLPRGLSFKESNIIWGVIQGSISIAISFFLIITNSKSVKIWVRALLICCCIMLFFWSILHPYKAQDKSQSEFGLKLQKAIIVSIAKTQKENIEIENFSENTILYIDKMEGLYGECNYIGCQIVKIHDKKDLENSEKCIFLISSGPPYSGREWENLLPLNTEYEGIRIYLRRGIIKELPKDE